MEDGGWWEERKEGEGGKDDLDQTQTEGQECQSSLDDLAERRQVPLDTPH